MEKDILIKEYVTLKHELFRLFYTYTICRQTC